MMMKKWIALLLCLLIPATGLAGGLPALDAPAAVEEGFVFRNGVRWGMSVQEVLAAEGRSDEDESVWMDDTSLAVLMTLENVTVSRYDNSQLGYIFFKDELVAGIYAVQKPEGMTGDDMYTDLRTALESKYGPFADGGRMILADAFSLSETADMAELVLADCTTTLSDGTAIALTKMDDTDMPVGITYCDYERLARLQGMDTGDDAFELRNGIRWGMNIWQVLWREGLTENDLDVDIDNNDDAGLACALISNRTVSRYDDAELDYLFIDNALAAGVYTVFTKDDRPADNVYTYLRSALESKYGAFTDGGEEDYYRYLSVFDIDSIDEMPGLPSCSIDVSHNTRIILLQSVIPYEGVAIMYYNPQAFEAKLDSQFPNTTGL